MTSHLTLVVDNSEQHAPSSARVPGGNHDTDALAGLPVAGTGQVSPPHWVHRLWVPRARTSRTSMFRRPQQHPVFGRVRTALANDRGAVTAEYAVVIIAAVAFAGLLVAIMRSGEIRQMLVDLVQSALGTAG